MTVLELRPHAPREDAPSPADPDPVEDCGFSAALREARKTAGLTQEELADRSGLSVRAIRNLENGRTGRPRPQSVGLLAEALGVPSAQLVPVRGLAGGGPRAVPAPSELPAGWPEPIGRAALIKDLCDAVGSGWADARGTDGPDARLAVVTGPPGSGKTSVVAHAAHLLSPEFPDRQVYIDLEGHLGEPMTAAAVAERLLRSLGLERRVYGPQEAAARARAALAGHRAIVVLDNAVGEAQIRPLICSAPRSAILVAARRALPALPAARHVQLGPLAPQDAEALLGRLAGAHRCAAEPAAVRGVARSCGYLPLAVHIAGLWLAARPHRSLTDLADRLADEHDRLDVLRIGDLSLRASVAAACRALTEAQLSVLPALRALPGLFTVDEVASRLALPGHAAADLVEELAQNQVIFGAHTGAARTGRYQLHESFRLYAAGPRAAVPLRRQVPARTIRWSA